VSEHTYVHVCVWMHVPLQTEYEYPQHVEHSIDRKPVIHPPHDRLVLVDGLKHTEGTQRDVDETPDAVCVCMSVNVCMYVCVFDWATNADPNVSIPTYTHTLPHAYSLTHSHTNPHTHTHLNT
jgi:hypothetical protein